MSECSVVTATGVAALGQERLWILDQLDPNSAAYNVAVAFDLDGLVDADRLESALGATISRHAALKTRLRSGPDGVLRQEVVEGGLGKLDVRPFAADDVKRFAETPFELSTGPLVRAALFIRSGSSAQFVLVMHHTVTDGWSVDLVVREVFDRYDGRWAPRKPDASYLRFAVEQRAAVAAGDHALGVAYWRRRLSDERPTEIPTDFARPSRRSSAGATIALDLATADCEALSAVARKAGVSNYTAVLGVVLILLWRYSSRRDLCVGTIVSGRTSDTYDETVGFFANTIPLCISLDPELTFREFLTRLDDQAVDAYEHSDVPFSEIVGGVNPPRDESRSPLFSVLIAGNTADASRIQVEDLAVSPSDLFLNAARFDLEFAIARRDDGWRVELTFNTALFHPLTMGRLLGNLASLTAEAVAAPNDPLVSYNGISNEEQRRQLAQWNATEMPYDSQRSLPDRIDETIRSRPNEIALVSPRGEQMTYSELDCAADLVVESLRSAGAKTDQPVGLLSGRSFALISGLLGIWRFGAPMLALDAEHPRERIAYMLETSSADVVLVEPELESLIAGLCRPILLTKAAGPERGASSRRARRDDEPAYVLFTSGSTGAPKGVVIPHRTLTNLASWHLRTVPRTPARTLQFSSIGFDVFFQELCTLAAGGTLVLVDEHTRAQPSELLRHVTTNEITHIYMPFFVLDQLAAVATVSDAGHLDYVATAGEQIVVTPHLRKFFVDRPRVVLENHYGPTETHLVSKFALAPDPAQWVERPPIGWPVDNATLFILDNRGQPLPTGAVGELFVGGQTLADGYVRRGGLTAERFVPSPFDEQGGRIYRTGDLARFRHDGAIEFLGRNDDQVKFRGYRIELEEIEAVMSGCRGVAQCAVVVAVAPSGERCLVAHVVPSRWPTDLDVRIVRRAAQARLPAYMLPTAVRFAESLPFRPSGKLDRGALIKAAELFLRDLRVEREAAIGPLTATEEAVAAIWSSVLSVDDLSPADDFFDLGGHSILAARIVSRVRQEFAIDLAMRTLFVRSQLAEFASVVDEAIACSATGMPPGTPAS